MEAVVSRRVEVVLAKGGVLFHIFNVCLIDRWPFLALKITCRRSLRHSIVWSPHSKWKLCCDVIISCYLSLKKRSECFQRVRS